MPTEQIAACLFSLIKPIIRRFIETFLTITFRGEPGYANTASDLKFQFLVMDWSTKNCEKPFAQCFRSGDVGD